MASEDTQDIENSAADAAGPERTPRAALAALRPQARTVGPVTLGPFTLEHWIALQDLDNPVVVGGTPTKRQVVEAAGLMTLAPDVMQTDKALLTEQAHNSGRHVAGQLLPSDFPALIEAVNGAILDGFATHIPVKPAEGEGREKKAPPAGSSTSSKRSGG